MRRLALALSLALLAACTQDPPGRCEQDLDCRAGQICEGGLCLRLVTDHQIGSLCARDSDCVWWGACVARACTLRPGLCDLDGDCAGWQVCDLGPHTCATGPGFCAADPDCASWQTCGPAHLCVTAGACTSSAGCAGWESCDASGACAPAIACTSGSECVPGDVCPAGGGFCTSPVTLDPGAVHLLGTFVDPSGAVDAVGALSSPTRSLAGFPAGTGAAARIAPDGSLVYERVSVGRSLHRFVPDPLEWDAVSGAWRLPADPAANDPAVSTPGCPTDVGEWLVQAGTGEIRYACAADPAVWYGTLDATPVVSGYRLLAWDAAGRMLAVRGGDTLVVLDASLVEIPASGAPSLTGYGLLAARTHAGGFWLAVQPPAAGGPRRWTVDGAGAFADEGAFSAAPVDLSAGPPAVLDATGALHLRGTRLPPAPEPPQDVVVRCQIEPGGCTLAYDEAAAVPQDWAATPPHLYLLVDGSPLATGP
ncbi:MAG TPA: hypothetical protein VLS93_05905 [Anaeromyxobacteraceae bacterium]|nr:hypothetical protein [Anaeromyxobacteraceae bacterium]